MQTSVAAPNFTLQIPQPFVVKLERFENTRSRKLTLFVCDEDDAWNKAFDLRMGWVPVAVVPA